MAEWGRSGRREGGKEGQGRRGGEGGRGRVSIAAMPHMPHMPHASPPPTYDASARNQAHGEEVTSKGARQEGGRERGSRVVVGACSSALPLRLMHESSVPPLQNSRTAPTRGRRMPMSALAGRADACMGRENERAGR